jgi:hypothetical protein
MLEALLIAGLLVFSALFYFLFKASNDRFESPYLAAGLSATLAVLGFVLFGAWVLGNARPWNEDRACFEMLRSWCVEERCLGEAEACADGCEALAREALEAMGDGADCERPAGLFE